MNTIFELIKPNADQIAILYELLKNRENSISHEEMPSYSEHSQFIHNHPYRAWYLLYKKNTPIGSIYLMEDNSLGLSLNEVSKQLILDIITQISSMHKPLPPLKSVRSKYFHLNVSPKNKQFMSIFTDIGLLHSQCTFVIKD
ncbi:hypothetical protein G6700_01740 [Polynucleobacter paneuropaeus]|nr:hypothetical protein G6700_01740 [Polynucleobacter paneuropaeus]